MYVAKTLESLSLDLLSMRYFQQFHKLTRLLFRYFTFRMVLGLATFGITFGIQKLSWNLYLNLFIFNVVNIPAKGLSIWLQNRYCKYTRLRAIAGNTSHIKIFIISAYILFYVWSVNL